MNTISDNIEDLIEFGMNTAAVLAAQWGFLLLLCMGV